MRSLSWHRHTLNVGFLLFCVEKHPLSLFAFFPSAHLLIYIILDKRDVRWHESASNQRTDQTVYTVHSSLREGVQRGGLERVAREREEKEKMGGRLFFLWVLEAMHQCSVAVEIGEPFRHVCAPARAFAQSTNVYSNIPIV